MRKCAAVLVMMLLPAIAVYSQSLADLANKERERRQAISNDKVITPDEVAKFSTGPSKSEPDAEPEEPASKEESGVAAVEPVDFQGRTESYWRKTMADARKKVEDLEREANVITLRISDLQNKFYSEDNGFAREGIQRELQKSYYEQDKNKEELAKAKEALRDLQNEARKSGALPGWIE